MADEALPLNMKIPMSLFDGGPPVTFIITLSDADAQRVAAADPRKVRVFGDLMLTVQDAVLNEARSRT